MRKEKLEIFQRFLNEQRMFRIDGYENTYPTLEEFIYHFQLGALEDRQNIYLDDNSVMKRGWRRSLVDTILAAHHHHNASIEDVINVFKNFKEQNGELRGRYCPDIGRLIIWLHNSGLHPNIGVSRMITQLSSHSKPDSPIDKRCENLYLKDLFEDNTEG